MDASGRVAAINDKLGLLNDLVVVVIRMVGDDQYAVIRTKVIQRCAPELEVILSAFFQHREVRVVVADRCALCLQQVNDGQGRRFAKVIDIFV